MDVRPVVEFADLLRHRPGEGQHLGRSEAFTTELAAAHAVLARAENGDPVPHCGCLLWGWLVGPTPRKAKPFATQVSILRKQTATVVHVFDPSAE